jgi:rod shape determining protein RodA
MLILLQPDAGSALVFMSFLMVLYREGLNPSYYWGGSFLAFSLILGLVISPVAMFMGLLLIGLFVLAAQMEKNGFWLLGTGLIGVGTIYLYQTGDYYREILIVLISAYLVLLMVLYRRKARQVMFPVTAAILIGGGVAFAANYAFNKVLQPHQQDRIMVWLQPSKADPQGSYYNIMQSKLAISSGGLTGRGFLKGNMTKLNYVPEQSTDFIFCTIGEEQGFTGVFALVILFLMFLFRILKLAERQRSDFARIYAYGLLGILFIHFFINIGMTMGIMPVIGIPLPFISKGGSSLLGFTIMISVLLRMDKYRFRL